MASDKPTIGIFTTDARLVIRSWDGWLAAAAGIAPERACGQSLLALFPEIGERGLSARFEKVLSDGTVEVLSSAFHRYLIPCLPAHPSARYERMQQQVTIAPLLENGQVVGTLVTVEDVTARLDREHELARQLASDDDATRLRAAEALAEEEGEFATRKLAGSLGDDNWRVRKTAVDALARKAGAEEVELLLRALREQHRDPGILNSALQVLALSGIDAIEPLVGFLNDGDTDLRIYATQALGDQRDRRAVPGLMRALADESENVRYHAIEALGKLRAAAAVEALAKIAEARDFFLAYPALDAMTEIGDPRVAPRLVGLLEDDLLRAPVADLLGHLGDEEVLAPLVTLLNTPASSSTAPAGAHILARAIASLYDRYERSYGEGAYIAELARSLINAEGARNLVAAIDKTSGQDLRALALVLGWLEGEEVERALIRLLGQEKARKEVVEALVRYGGRASQLLIEQLQSSEIEIRQAAVTALGRIGHSSAVPALLRLLREDEEVVIPVAGALGQIGDRRALEALLELLADPDAAVRQAAIAAINSLGHPDMAARAGNLLVDENPYVRESAVKIAGYFGYLDCADLLLERRHDEVESVRRAAVEHLPYLDDRRVLPALLDALQTDTPSVRAAAASALSQVDGEEVEAHLIAALSDADAWVRYFAIHSIGAHRLRASLDALTAAAQADEANQVRIAAVDALGKIDDPRAIIVLISVMESGDADLSRAAIKSLGGISQADAQPPLLKALRSPDSALRREVMTALGRRGGKEAIQALQWAAVAEVDPKMKQTAIRALAQVASPDAIATLIDLSAEPLCREACVEALARFGEQKFGEQKVNEIGKGLAHAHPSVRRAVVEALGRMKRPRATELLVGGLDDEDASVRLATASALAYLGSQTAERQLIRVMRTDPDTGVRRAAQKALGTK